MDGALPWVVGIGMPLLVLGLGWLWSTMGKHSDRLDELTRETLTQGDLNPLGSRIATAETALSTIRREREDGDKASEAYTQSKVAELHTRLNDTQRDYVRRDDFHRELGAFREEVRREMAAIAETLKEVSRDGKAAATALNGRFDGLYTLLGKMAPPAE